MVSPLNLSAIISLIKKSRLKGANPAVIISRGLIKIFETTATAGERKKQHMGVFLKKIMVPASWHAASQPRWGAEKVLDQKREESQRCCKWQIKKGKE
jgi:hypothetical protein